MSVSWANRDEIATRTAFEALHSGLTIQLIATPRQHLHTCNLEDAAAAVIGGNTNRFDFLPVIRPGGEQIVGLFHAARLADDAAIAGPVSDYLMPLSEEVLIAGDASILDFIKVADSTPCRLVLAGPGISGLVSLSDLQRLPVRAALFALITGFEMTMTEAIREWYPTQNDWLGLISGTRQQRILDEIAKSHREDRFVDSLLFTQFCDKADIARKSNRLLSSKSALSKTLSSLQKLRNRLAHSNEFAASLDEARHVCRVVKDLLKLRGDIVTLLKTQNGHVGSRVRG